VHWWWVPSVHQVVQPCGLWLWLRCMASSQKVKSGFVPICTLDVFFGRYLFFFVYIVIFIWIYHKGEYYFNNTIVVLLFLWKSLNSVIFAITIMYYFSLTMKIPIYLNVMLFLYKTYKINGWILYSVIFHFITLSR
jgi:hypothetical protein